MTCDYKDDRGRHPQDDTINTHEGWTQVRRVARDPGASFSLFTFSALPTPFFMYFPTKSKNHAWHRRELSSPS